MSDKSSSVAGDQSSRGGATTENPSSSGKKKFEQEETNWRWYIGGSILIFLFIAVSGIYVMQYMNWTKADDDYNAAIDAAKALRAEAQGKSCPLSGDFAPRLIRNVGGVQVLCDSESDNGGWLIFQRRQNGQVSFDQPYNAYVNGFGDLEKFTSYWLGLNNINHFCGKPNQCELRVDLEYRSGTKSEEANRLGLYYAQYSSFSVGSAESKFPLAVSGYTGTAGDSLSAQNGAKFTAKDQDNDQQDGKNCASERRAGGFWYTKQEEGSSTCARANPNGQIGANFAGMFWQDLTNFESATFMEMKLRVKNSK